MRLRKRAIRTQFSEPSADFSRFKLIKRQTTEVLRKQNKSQEFLNQKGKQTHHIKHSSEFNPNIVNFKQGHKIAGELNRISWKKLRLPFQQNNRNHSIRKSNDAAQGVALLNNHLLNVAIRPSRSHKRTTTEPCLSLKSSRTKREFHENQPMDPQQFERCCEIVDEIYNKVKLLKQLGYAQFKINEWVLNYCENRRPYMKDVFMKNVSKSLYTLQEQFELQKNNKIVKEKLRFKIQKGRDIFYFIQEEELAELCKYLEEILIQKNTQKAKQVESSIVQKLSNELIPRLKNKFFVFTKKEPIQVSNFAIDLAHFEQKYGDFMSLSKVNKLKFLELNRVQQNLKGAYQSMLDGQIKKIVKQTHQGHQSPACFEQNPQYENL